MRGPGAQPRLVVRGGKAPRQKKNIYFFKFLLSPEEKNTKSILSQKIRIAQKKSFEEKKMSVTSIPIFPANLATFEEN